MIDPHNRTPEKKERFLVELRKRRSVYHACKAVKIGRRTAYDWRDDDEEFMASWDDALADATDVLEQSLYQRALKGDTTASIFLLKAYDRKRFGDQQKLEHTGPDGGPIQVENPIASLSDAELVTRLQRSRSRGGAGESRTGAAPS
jgi:hypothetical protein